MGKRFKVEVNRDDYTFPSPDKAVIKSSALADNLQTQRFAVLAKLEQVAPLDANSVSVDDEGQISVTDPNWVQALREALDTPLEPGAQLGEQNVCSNGSC